MQHTLPGMLPPVRHTRVDRVVELLRLAEVEVERPLSEHHPDALHDVWHRMRADISDALHAFDLAQTEIGINQAFAET